MELRIIREALASPDPARAAIAALVAFHALRGPELERLQMTDIRDGYLHLADRVIPLAEPVKESVSAYLDYRNARWPGTANPHLFITRRTAGRTCPPSISWVRKTLAARAQAIREDRILDEANATGGDIRRLCDLFGLSVSGAHRYAATIEHPDLAHPPPERQPAPGS
jgi:hypothetical protein